MLTLYLKAGLLQVGTFTSSGDSESNFVLTNGTFVGDGLCSGKGVFGTDDTSSNLTVVDGEGSVAGTGIFHFPQGLFNGTGLCLVFSCTLLASCRALCWSTKGLVSGHMQDNA